MTRCGRAASRAQAVETRHGPAWRRELRAKDVSEDVWLAHLYQMLYDLNQTTKVRRPAERCCRAGWTQQLMCVAAGRHA